MVSRRRFLKAAGAAALVGALSPAVPWSGLARFTGAEQAFQVTSALGPHRVFPQSVASGDPTPTGAVVWTRIAPEAVQEGAELAFEVATDEAMQDVVHRTVLPPVDPAHAHTARLDLDGLLEPDRHYHYRFIYAGVASRVGRLRTLPEAGARPDAVRFAVLTCMNHQNGYFPALGHVAQDDVDFVVHLGDFIYEYAGQASYNGKRFEGRGIELPSGRPQMHDRRDLDHVWATYRSDEHVQAMLERHTLIVTWDDHEIADDRFFDYTKGQGMVDSESHLVPGTDDAVIDALFRDGAQAYFDWLPLRIHIDRDAEDALDVIRLYRDFRFGDLVHLWILDERWFRSQPPWEGLGSPGPEAVAGSGGVREDPDATMLGTAQKAWLKAGVQASPAKWQLFGQQVQMSPLAVTLPGTTVYLNADAWDGYEAERQELAELMGAKGDCVVLTGDLHSYMAGYVKRDYDAVPEPAGNRVAVEFMTPGVTSAGLGEIVEQATGKPVTPGDDEVMEAVVLSGNPHMQMFNSTRHGYSVVEVLRDRVRYTAYVVDKSQSGVRGNRRLFTVQECRAGTVALRETFRQSPSGLDAATLAGRVPRDPGPEPSRRVRDVKALKQALAP